MSANPIDDLMWACKKARDDITELRGGYENFKARYLEESKKADALQRRIEELEGGIKNAIGLVGNLQMSEAFNLLCEILGAIPAEREE